MNMEALNQPIDQMESHWKPTIFTGWCFLKNNPKNMKMSCQPIVSRNPKYGITSTVTNI
jgi:hypothetical protein